MAAAGTGISTASVRVEFRRPYTADIFTGRHHELGFQGNSFEPSSPPSTDDASTYIRELRTTFHDLAPVIPADRHPQSVFVSQDLHDCSHVFVRCDQIRPPLTPAYDGPFRVLHCAPKTFTLDITAVKTSWLPID
ncbi:hypothetical protein HPB50_014431 [Hyalomma asiaticum]|uniref:Uncharacterized protein n=1 Tax=Hyalomma asiaticum TaxID=266040 RepID=A0ACB7TAM0_HYAAI|nr:hypothetical protein HPB50_014431 [Hyalomma asiaticum]